MKMDKAYGRIIQDILYEKIITYYNNDVFSACSCSFSHNSSITHQIQRITAEYNENFPLFKGEAQTVFDLASLTKPLVTLLSVLFLIDKGKIDWDSTLEKVFGKKRVKSLSSINISMLLGHSSGLPAHRDFAEMLRKVRPAQRRAFLFKQICKEDCSVNEDIQTRYSDLGYMLLGFVVEEISGKPLDIFWSTNIIGQLDLQNKLFFPKADDVQKRFFAPTGCCRFTFKQLNGIVHDDNCRLSGGVCGHAGLFGTASSVLSLGEELLALYQGKKSALPIKTETFRSSCRRNGLSDWSRGFQLPTPGKSSSGKYFSPESFGHLGFTGTSLWIDPRRDLVVVLLTNRVVKGEDSVAIQQVRPDFHDTIVEFLEEQRPAS
jgi:serine-type D-Ala-D-Ala carboxypeptidase